MSTTLIPLPANTSQWCDLLFHLSKPLILTESEFGEYWPLVSTVYTKIGGLLLQQNGELEVQKYECRLRKSKKGGKPPPGPAGGVKKCYGKTVRVPGLCDVRIKIVRTVSAPITITIQRLDEHEHSHTLERSREIAPSTLALQLAATDANAKEAHNDFRVKNLAIVNKDYPELSLFPGPVQKLVGPEIDAVPERIAQGKPTPEFDDNLTCHCGYI